MLTKGLPERFTLPFTVCELTFPFKLFSGKYALIQYFGGECILCVKHCAKRMETYRLIKPPALAGENGVLSGSDM